MNTLLCLSIAFVGGLLATKAMKIFNLPNVTGFLIAGLIIGPSICGFVSAEDVASFSIISDVALGFIAFSIGVEFKFSHLKELGGKVIVITLFQSLLAVALVDVALIAFGADTGLSLVLGAIAAATAPAATLMVIRQYRASGPVVETLLPVVAFDDAVGLVVFSVSIALARVFSTGAELTVQSILVTPLIEIIGSLALGLILGAALWLLNKWFKLGENKLISAILVVFAATGLVQLVSSLWGIDMSGLLVCMMVGATFTNMCVDETEVLSRCDAWSTPLLMLFFVISGAQLDISVIPSIGVIGVIYILARSIGKYVGAYTGCKLTKANPVVTKYLGWTLLPQAGVEIGMAQVAMAALPAIGAQINTVVLCAIFVYAIIGPIITKIALTKAGEIQPNQKRVKDKAHE